MTDTFHTKHFNCIQALRGFTALFVTLEHVRFLSCGAFGVDIFFCISGFMAMYATHHTSKHFLKKRLIRIYPFYAFMTIATFFALKIFPGMFHLTKADPLYLVKSLLFIPFEISDGIVQPLVRVGWTVNYEMFFYLLFAMSMAISHKYRGLICSIFLGSLVVLTKIVPTTHTIPNFYGDYIQLEFILGILSYYIIQKMYILCENKGKYITTLCKLCCLIVPALFILLAITKQQTPITGMGRVLYWGLPGCIIVLLTFLMDLCLKPAKWMILLGNMSFSIYLIHYYPLMFIDRKIFSLEHFSPLAVVVTCLGLVLVLGISYITYQLIEKKFSCLLRQLIK